MKKAIVTGATGFIGGALVKKLLALGVTVYAVDIPTSPLASFTGSEKFKPVYADFLSYKNLQDSIRDNDIDVFFHLAWAGGFTEALKNYHLQLENASFAGDALVSAKQIGCKKFVYANTYNQFEIQSFLAAKNFSPRYTCIYSTAKTAANLICKTLAFQMGIDYCDGLIPMPYGEGNRSKQLVNVVIDHLLRGESPRLVAGKNYYDLVYIDDIVNAFIAIAESGKNQQEYYIGHRALIKFKEWIEKMRDVLNPKVDLKFGEYKDEQCIDYSLVDLDALYNDTGFECIADFESCMKRTAKWLVENDLARGQ